MANQATRKKGTIAQALNGFSGFTIKMFLGSAVLMLVFLSDLAKQYAGRI